MGWNRFPVFGVNENQVDILMAPETNGERKKMTLEKIKEQKLKNQKRKRSRSRSTNLEDVKMKVVKLLESVFEEATMLDRYLKTQHTLQMKSSNR